MTPLVTVVVPARNEAAHIEACVRSVLGQSVAGGLELLVVDGRSDDATPALARTAGARVLDNPARTIPAALNVGLAAARGEVVLRFDAHAEMPAGYVSACLRALEEERAANVGGWREVRAAGPWGRAVGTALASRLGVGNSRIWRRPGAGERRRDVETVPLGCFRAEILRAVGGWDERLLANEDFDLNHRLRGRGGRVVFDPAISSIYRPREKLSAIAGQYLRYGRWKAEMLADAPGAVRPRQLMPPALVLTAVAATLPSRARGPARSALVAYGACLALEARRLGAGPRLPLVFVTMHACWAAGLLGGLGLRLVQRAPARRARTASPTHPARSRAARNGLARGRTFEIAKYGVWRPPKARTKCSTGSSIEPSKSNASETSAASRIASQ